MADRTDTNLTNDGTNVEPEPTSEATPEQAVNAQEEFIKLAATHIDKMSAEDKAAVLLQLKPVFEKVEGTAEALVRAFEDLGDFAADAKEITGADDPNLMPTIGRMYAGLVEVERLRQFHESHMREAGAIVLNALGIVQ